MAVLTFDLNNPFFKEFSITVHIFVIQVPEKESGPLKGVVICVGKKLTKMQSDLNAVAASLGADFRQDF